MAMHVLPYRCRKRSHRVVAHVQVRFRAIVPVEAFPCSLRRVLPPVEALSLESYRLALVTPIGRQMDAQLPLIISSMRLTRFPGTHSYKWLSVMTRGWATMSSCCYRNSKFREAPS